MVVDVWLKGPNPFWGDYIDGYFGDFAVYAMFVCLTI